MEKQILSFIRDLACKNIYATYVFFLFNGFLQAVFPPYPGDTLIIFQGYLTYYMGFNKFMMLLNTTIGSFLGSLLLYFISYKESNRVLNNKFLIKLFSIDKIHKLENWFRKYGSFLIIINKFIPGFSSITFISAGIFKIPKTSAIISIFIANLLYNTMLFTAGFLTGDNIDVIKYSIREYSKLIILSLTLFSFVYVYIKKTI